MTLIRHLHNQQQLQEVLASNAPLVIIDIYADWCGPCKILAPHMERLAVDHQSQSVVVCKVNSEEMQMENVNSLPTIQFWALQNGQRRLVHTVVGANLQAIQDAIRNIMGTNPSQNFANSNAVNSNAPPPPPLEPPVAPKKKNDRGRIYATYRSL